MAYTLICCDQNIVIGLYNQNIYFFYIDLGSEWVGLGYCVTIVVILGL